MMGSSPNSRVRTIPCCVCGTEFTSCHPRSKLCSDACRSVRQTGMAQVYQIANRGRLAANAKRRYRENPTPHIERSRQFGHSDRGRALQRERSAVRRVTEREKIGARTDLNNAVRDGRIQRQPCRDCGSPDTHGHHHDYSRPLDVIWLCPEHHIAEHKRIDNG